MFAPAAAETSLGTMAAAGLEPDATVAAAQELATYAPANSLDGTSAVTGEVGTGDAGTGTSGTAATGAAELGAVVARSSGPLKVGQSFSARYHVIKLLGAGGMGAVYQAWDAELGVAVALKVIRTDHRRRAASVEAEKRFKNELLLARQVTHKNVVRIHDLGEIDGIKYITMPYVQGDDLSTLLRATGKLPIARALRLARQVAGGLEAAHDAGVVHRDLKPPNIMISAAGEDEQALIMDFGISSSTDDVTEGSIAGTLEYMSPEQGSGQAVDARSDLYAFGVILYEMLAGPRSDTSKTVQDRITAMKQRFAEGFPSLRTIDDTIPEPLAALVARCLEGDSAARFQTTGELTAALARLDDEGQLIPEVRRLTTKIQVAAAAVVVVLLGTTWYFSRGPAVPFTHPPVSVVLADFENRTGDPLFNGTLEPALMNNLERASFINTVKRGDPQVQAALAKPGARLDEQTARLISIRDGYQFVVSGSIEPAARGYKLTVNVVDPPADGKVLKTYTESIADKSAVLGAVASIAAKVRTQLGDTKGSREETATSETFTAGSLEAVRAYTAANSLAVQAKDAEAIVEYQRALQLDPNLGRAYSGWAISAAKLGRADEAAELWKKALALLDRMTEREKYRTLGTYYSRVVGNQAAAIENFTKLLERYPADGAGHNNLALAYFRSLNMPKALEEGGRVLAMYPKTQLYRDNFVLYAMYGGDFKRGADEAKRIVAEVPTANHAYLPIAIGAAADGRFDDAKAAYAGMMKADSPGPSVGMTGLADLAIYQGRYAEAETLLKSGIATDKTSNDTVDMAAKMNALAELYEAEGRTALAVTTAESVLKLGKGYAMVVPAARVLARAKRKDAAAAVADDLGKRLQPRDRAYGSIIRGEIALSDGNVVAAVDRFREAQKLADLWLTRYMLGVAYVQAEAYPEALSELEASEKRRGEGAALFLEDSPTLRYLAALPYWLGRAQEKVGITVKAGENFQRYITLRAEAKPADPLVADARRRISVP
jgi:tetratricopeptide (TPR) repeat protein/tRNA A-37 threonylcarbamoyl transferase component Bud32